ncbi:hypothetical protein SAMN06275492_15714 [Dethiosulfovibrio salsuginis]|uniref:Uncharacterized protein n=1 Tax=Dethiosulfovibrio salsuginis TaxID=561720 RepID=A0A1X7LDV2_9BACT|nr:hypothetical protein SAMN06275492_15714 [Dethiosulfovibrio salsuginis]
MANVKNVNDILIGTGKVFLNGFRWLSRHIVLSAGFNRLLGDGRSAPGRPSSFTSPPRVQR